MRLLTNQERPEEEQGLTRNHQEKTTSLVWDTMNLGETVHLELKKEAADEDLGAFSPQAEQEATAKCKVTPGADRERRGRCLGQK